MNLIQLSFEGHIDIIFDNFTPEDVIKKSSLEIILYIMALSQYSQWSVINQLLEELKQNAHPDYQNIYDLAVYFIAFQHVTIIAYRDIKDEIYQRIRLLNTSDDNLKILMVLLLSKHDNSTIDEFYANCQELGLDQLDNYNYFRGNICHRTGFIQKKNESLRMLAFEKSLYSKVECQLNESPERLHYDRIKIIKYVIEFYHKRKVSLEELITAIHKYSVSKNLLCPYDVEPVVLNFVANKIRLLGDKETSLSLVEYSKSICSSDRWDSLSYSYLCIKGVINDFINWYDRQFFREGIPVDKLLLTDYIYILYASKQYNKLYETYEEHKDKLKNLDPIRNFSLHYTLARYFTNTHQIKRLSQLPEFNDNVDLIKLKGDCLIFYKRLVAWANSIIALVVSKGFLVEEYHENIVECSVCLEDVDSKSTIIKCPKCTNHVGHITCLTSWFSNKDSCPLCRYKLY